MRYLREKLGLNQTQAAIKLDISRVNYNRYEKGDRTPDNDTLKRIADFYDITIDYLLGHEDQQAKTLKPKEDKKPKDLKRILEQHDIMFDGVPIDEDAKKEIMHIVEFELYKRAKELNKRKKATPDS